MRNIIALLFMLSCCGTFAQKLNDIFVSPSLTVKGNQITLSMQLNTVKAELGKNESCELLPVITDGVHRQAFDVSSFAKGGSGLASKRAAMLAKRRGESVEGGAVRTYESSAVFQNWMSRAHLEVVVEKKSNGAIVSRDVVNLTVTPQESKGSVAILPVSVSAPVSAASSSASSISDLRSATSGSSEGRAAITYVGSYIEPDEDLIDARNKEELDFTIEEARVVADINPEMLSLRNLYQVALSYKNDPQNFRRILNVSVEIYPASPIANLNAASCALEAGDIEAATPFVKKMQTDIPEYRNVRGIYEMLIGNTNEGIRLLKAAKRDGLAEADRNLSSFFEYYQKKR